MQVKAEIVLTLHKLSIKDSFKSFEDLADALRAAIPDSQILKKFTLGRLKAAILVREALGPYFKRQMLMSIDKRNYFTIQHDETTNDAGKKELQIAVRYFSTETEQVLKLQLHIPYLYI